MAEYIEREVAIMKLMQDGCSAKNLQSISDIPAADVAPVVRCMDCKHLSAVNVNGKGIPTCRVSGVEVAPDEFCSRGEKERR